jgi:cell division protein FtsN
VTVVLVVTFLFGVLVGRGVREGGAPQIASGDIASDPVPVPASEPAGPSSATGGAAPAPAAEELSYADRLLRDSAPPETLKPAAQPAPAPVVHEPVSRKAPVPPPPAAAPKEPVPAQKEPVPAPAPAPAPSVRTPPTVTSGPQNAPVTPAPAPVTAAKASDPSGPGFAVQVAAYRDRRDADTLAKQLAAKGYPAFVMDPVKGTSTALFRVRVGKYKTLKDAEAVESRLQTSEQLTNAWIAR